MTAVDLNAVFLSSEGTTQPMLTWDSAIALMAGARDCGKAPHNQPKLFLKTLVWIGNKCKLWKRKDQLVQALYLWICPQLLNSIVCCLRWKLSQQQIWKLLSSGPGKGGFTSMIQKQSQVLLLERSLFVYEKAQTPFSLSYLWCWDSNGWCFCQGASWVSLLMLVWERQTGTCSQLCVFLYSGQNTSRTVSALSSVPKTRDPQLLDNDEDFPLWSVFMYVCVCRPLVNILALKLSTVCRKGSKPLSLGLASWLASIFTNSL